MPNTNVVGSWGAVQTWPLIGLHMVMTPDGKIVTYGTDQNGTQSGLHILDSWDPITGKHTVIEQDTGTDLFCTCCMIIPETGNILVAGGDARPYGTFNGGVQDADIYNPVTQTLTHSPTGDMQFARWYATPIELANGSILMLGGRDGGTNLAHYSAYAEIYTPGYGFHTLANSYIDTFSTFSLYPRSWLNSSGNVITFSPSSGNIYSLNPTGDGNVTVVGGLPTAFDWTMPAIEFAQDKILLIANNGTTWIMDISGATPKFTQTANYDGARIWANLTVLADGRVLLTGGSSVDTSVNQVLQNVNYTAEVWDPTTGQWTILSNAAVPRLYHSATMLLADGTVLSDGGGAPGPVANLNAEIYSPYYLFNADGSAATRPVIVDAPAEVLPGAQFTLHVTDPVGIKSLALMPFGDVTHSFNFTAKRIELTYTVQPDGSFLATLPNNPNVLTPGYWQLWAIDNNGTPSLASTVKIDTQLLYDLPTQLPLDLVDINMVFAHNGEAAYDSYNDRYIVTPDAPNKLGSFVTAQRVDLSKAFDLKVTVNLGKVGGGDGLGIVLENDPAGTAAIGTGGGQGLTGIQNGFGIDLNGATADFVKTADGSAQTGAVGTPNLHDGNWHNVELASNGANVTFYVDGVQEGTLTLAAAEALLGGTPLAYLGFTGDTTGNTAQQELQIQILTATTESGQAVNLNRANLAKTVAFTNNGSATYDATAKVYTETTAVAQEHGSTISQVKYDLSQSFRLTFDINVGNNPAGAEGVGFVFHNDPAGANALGTVGAGLGLVGIQNGLGIEFDTNQNATDASDIANDHTNFLTTATGAALSTAYSLGSISDGHWHRVQFTSDGANVGYTVDGVQIATLTVAQVAALLGGTTQGYFGFTGSTGTASEVQQVRMVSLNATGADGAAYQFVGPNKDPIAANDTYTVAENGVLTVAAAQGVLANDTDPNGDPLHVGPANFNNGHYLYLAPLNGTLTMNANGGFTYTPNANFYGTDTFTYTADDGVSAVPATVTINVTQTTGGGGGGGTDPGFTLNGNALTTAAHTYTLTPNAQLQAGSVMSDVRVDLSKTFSLTYELNAGNDPNGADGTGFILHNDAKGVAALGALGGGLGMAGIKNGVGIEFDVYDNPDSTSDIATDHTNFDSTGAFGALNAAKSLGTITNGLWHTIVVTSDGTNLTYTFDGVAEGTLSIAAAEAQIGGQFAYFGFTGATGGGTELQQVKIDALTATSDTGVALGIGGTGGGGGGGTAATFTDNGNATTTGADAFTVTPDAQLQDGSVMSNQRVDLSKTFDMTFEINLGNKAASADGMGFVLHNDAKGAAALGSVGGGLGMAGIKNGIGIEFDTFDNLDNPSDIATDHTNFDATAAFAALTTAHSLGEINDGLWHTVHVTSNGTNLSYTFDGTAIATLTVAAAEAQIGGQYAYFGFTGATGGLSELAQVKIDSLTATTDGGAALSLTGGTGSGGGGGTDPGFTDNGNALTTASHAYTLTPNVQLQGGSVMSDVRVDLSKTFDLTFELNAGNNPNGADGTGFVLHNDAKGVNALGAIGGGLGMAGIKNGLGIEFDVYDNADSTSDIAANHTNFDATGAFAALTAAKSLGTITDGLWHTVHVTSDGTNLSYTFDGVAEGTITVAAAEAQIGGKFAYFGFTGATGGGTELQQVKIDSLTATSDTGVALGINNGTGGGGGGTGNGYNIIQATAGNDNLVGTAGNDQLIGRAGGNDVMTGNGGNDIFVFKPGFGNAQINDFTKVAGNRDLIDLTAFNLGTGYNALNHVTVNGTDTIFNMGNGDTLTVHKTAAGNVTNLLVDDLLI